MYAQQFDSEHERWMWHCCAAALQAAIASWRRRNARLLEINSGCGQGLQVLWECGFDVTGTAADYAERRQAALVAPCGTEILAAADDDLPLESDSFEWVILHLAGHDAQQSRAAALEAARIASRGLVITFWNRNSLFRLLPPGLRKCCPVPCRGQFLWQVLRAVHGIPGRKWLSGCLPLPFLSRQLFLTGALGRLCAGIFGVWTMIRFDFDAAAQGTPLGVRVGKAGSLTREAAVLECRCGDQEQQKDLRHVP